MRKMIVLSLLFLFATGCQPRESYKFISPVKGDVSIVQQNEALHITCMIQRARTLPLANQKSLDIKHMEIMARKALCLYMKAGIDQILAVSGMQILNEPKFNESGAEMTFIVNKNNLHVSGLESV